MASEAILKELFEVAKTSRQFAGMSNDDIWEACIAHKERPDADIRKAMENIHKKDQEAMNESANKRARLEEGKKKMIEIHKQEEIEHQKDEKDAESILAELF